MAILKRIKGNRTRILGVLISIVGVLQIYTPQIFAENEQLSGGIMAFFGILVIVLRQFTNTAPGQSEPVPEPAKEPVRGI